MKNLCNNTTTHTSPWFKEWFNTSYYHKLYKHRSEEEATNFIDRLLSILKPNTNASMIDVGCGNGRHCRQLGKTFSVTGIDIAPASIMEAKQHATAGMHFYEHDMRLPFGKNAYNYVFNFFTSFGYFKTKTEHHEVLTNMADALQPGGMLVLDYLNIHYAERQLVPTEQKEIDGTDYDLTRWMDEGYFYKQIVINDPSEETPLVYTEQVARFDLDDFEKMFNEHGLELQAVYGDYEFRSFSRLHSPRLLMIATRSSEC